MSKSISYRRNRDYSKQSLWTYELNRDLYHCYQKAKSDPKIRYMKRLKEYWDNLHPELDNFSSKNLRDQASRVVKNKVVMETEYEYIFNNNATENQETIQNVTQDNIIVNANEDLLPIISNENTSNTESLENLQIRESIEPLFYKYIDIIKDDISLESRIYPTSVNKTINDNILYVINDVAKSYLEAKVTPSYWDINTCLYASAVSCKEYINDLRDPIEKKPNKPKLPKWLEQLESNINSTRKLIGKLTTVIECKTLKSFTRHQNNLESNFKKRFGNSRLKTLEFKLSEFKQKLKGLNGKLRYSKKQIERRSINNVFSFNPQKIYRKFKGNQIQAENIPTKSEIESFWKNI